MSNTYIMRKGVSSVGDLVDGMDAIKLGVGNIYYVVKTSDTNVYNYLMQNKQRQYTDGSYAVHASATAQTAIDAAVAATVECRNDYVVVMPSDSDYDLTSVVTLNKKSVHVICPAGFGYDVGATNACRLHQNTAATAIFAVSDASIEIAGFYLKPYTDVAHITVAATSYGLNIHHNFFTLNWTSAPEPAISCSGDGGAWGIVSHHNLFGSMSGTSVTCASIITIQGSATGARCNHNSFVIGDSNTATVCINNGAVKGETNYNTFSTGGGTDGGTITHCISCNASGTAIGNRGTVADSVMVTGGTTQASFSDNMNGVDGGVVDSES